MQNTTHIVFIKGEFSPEDARALLVDLLNNKINFHRLRSFGLEERTGSKDAHTEQRITELRQSRDEIASIVTYAAENNCTLKINSVIEITTIQ